jgi:hypothetical protein
MHGDSDRPIAASRDSLVWVYSVEKPISQAHVILGANTEVAENPQ